MLVAIRTTIFSALLLAIPDCVFMLLNNTKLWPILQKLLHTSLTLTLAIIFVKHYADRYSVKVKNLWRISPSSLWGVLLIGTCGAIVGVGGQVLLAKLIWPPFTTVKPLVCKFFESYFSYSVFYKLLLTLFVFMLAASEELIYRGFLQTYIKKYTNRWNAIILSSLFFSISHIIPHNYPYVLAMGLTFGIVFELSGTIWTPILAHGLYNIIILVMF